MASASAACSAFVPPRRCARGPNRTFWRIVSQGNRSGDWNSMARSGLGPTTGRPSTETVPPSASRMPAARFSAVDLPHPDGPSRQTNSPRSTRRSTPARAVTLRPPRRKVLKTPASSSIAPLPSGIAPAPVVAAGTRRPTTRRRRAPRRRSARSRAVAGGGIERKLRNDVAGQRGRGGHARDPTLGQVEVRCPRVGDDGRAGERRAARANEPVLLLGRRDVVRQVLLGRGNRLVGGDAEQRCAALEVGVLLLGEQVIGGGGLRTDVLLHE